MSDEQKLLLVADKALALKDDLAIIKALGATIANWEKLAGKIDGAITAEALLTQIATDVNSSEIKKLFDDIGLGDTLADLKRLLGKATDAAGKVPQQVKSLLEPLDHFSTGDKNAVVAWSLSRTSSPVAKSDQYSIDLGGEAKVSFNAAASWPDDAVSPKLLSLGASGKVSAGAKATVPYGFGSVGAGLEGSANAAIDYYYDPPGKTFYALAVAERLGSLPNPFDLDALWEALADKPQALEGVVLGLGGAAKASLEVKFADARALGAGVIVDTGLKVAVSASLKSSYALSLRRAETAAGATAIRAELNRTRRSESELNAALTLDVDVAALTKPVAAAIKTAVDRWDAAIKPIRPFLSPGTWLRDQFLAQLKTALTPLVENEGLREAILADAAGAVGAGELETDAIVAWLADQVTGAIDQGNVLVDGKLDAATDRVMARLDKALPLLSEVLAAEGIDPKLKLKTLVSDQIARIDKGLKDQLAALFDGPGKDIAEPLRRAGSAVQGAVTSANAALKPVRDLIDRYDKLFHKILDKAQEAAKKKVTARLYAEESRLSETVLEIAGLFTGVTADSRIVFEDLTRGRMEPMVRLLETQPQVAGFALDPAASSLKRFSAYKAGQGFEIAFLDIANIAYSRLLSADTTVAVDGLGNVRVDLKGEMAKRLSFLTKTRSARFVESGAIVLAAASAREAGAPPPVLDLGVGASFADKKLDWSEVRDFVESLSEARLLSDTALADAKVVFDRWRTAAGGKIDGEISATLRLAGPSIPLLLQLGDRDNGALRNAAKKRIAAMAVQALLAGHAIERAPFLDGVSKVLSLTPGPKIVPVQDAIVDRVGQLAVVNEAPPAGEMPTIGNTPVVYTGGGDGQRNYVYFLRQAFVVNQLISLIETMGDIYESAPQAGAAPGWTRARYGAAQKTMLVASEFWLNVADDLVGLLFKGDVGRRTAAFMRAFADLAQLPVPGGVTLVMTNRSAAGAPETVSIS
ncbi:MAG: hypothetical protein KF842_07830 [Caulobacter sp.]|nr:hypothetical protein [Caulobacter sp.]